MIKVLEILAFVISAVAFGHGALRLFRKETPQFFRFYVCAAGCYMLEELWVIVNSLLGSGSQDGLVTVRLFGFFGCLCFLLSAILDIDELVKSEDRPRKICVPALAAPVILLGVYAVYAFSEANQEAPVVVVIGLAAISPALVSSYCSARHLRNAVFSTELSKTVKAVEVVTMLFYLANYTYPFMNLYCPGLLMSVYDGILAVVLLGIILLCERGAKQWKTCI